MRWDSFPVIIVSVSHPQFADIVRNSRRFLQEISKSREATIFILTDGYCREEMTANGSLPRLTKDGTSLEGGLIIVSEVKDVVDKFLREILHALGYDLSCALTGRGAATCKTENMLMFYYIIEPTFGRFCCCHFPMVGR